MIAQEQPPLLVYEYSGTARSGKGSVVNNISSIHPEVATDETGQDYRLVTWSLMQDGIIESDMEAGDVAKAIASGRKKDIVEVVANRSELVEEAGEEALYGSGVSSLVALVSPLDVVRGSVKAGFTKRIEIVRDSEEYQSLLVDGRNLAPVVRAVEGTELVMRSFLYCSPTEAATRECMRKALEPGTDEWEAEFADAHAMISERNTADSNRDTDPVKADETALNYWESSELREATIDHIAKLVFDGDHDKALNRMFGRDTNHLRHTRTGAGYIAVRDSRQLYLDTTPFRTHYDNSFQAMLSVAGQIFDEASQAYRLLQRS